MSVLAGALAVALAAVPGTQGFCVLPALRDLRCAPTPRGAVVGAEPAEAARLVRAITAAEDRFTIRFGRPPPGYALLLGDVPEPAMKALTAAGAASLLPWASEKQQNKAQRVNLLTMALHHPDLGRELRNQGVTQAEIAESVDEVWKAVGAELTMAIPMSTMTAHELAHDWFAAAFPFSAPETPGHRYGTPAPDWLDEAAALSVEGEAAAEVRRAEFRAAYSKARPEPDSLAILLTRTHPGMTEQSRPGVQLGAVTLPDGSRSTTSFSSTMNEAGPKDVFYPQTVVFSDYLQSRTGNPGVLGEVAAAIADGRSFEQWLAESVSGRRLGGSLPALEAGWRAWLLREYGAPASTGTQK